MKFVQSERSFNVSNHSQRVTRSSLGSVNKAKLSKNNIKSARNNNKNSKKLVKSGPILSDSIPLDDIGSKRYMTRSSLEDGKVKKAKTVKEPERKPSKRGVKKPIQSQQQNELAISKSSRPLRSSLPVCEIDALVSMPQSSAKGNKSKPAVLNKKSDVVSSVAQPVKHLKSSKSNCVDKNSTVAKDQTRVTRSSLGNASDSLSIQEKNPKRKLISSPEVKPTEKQVKTKKQTAKEKVQLKNQSPKRNTRSSLTSADINSDPLSNKSPKRKCTTKTVALPKPGKEIEKIPTFEEKNAREATTTTSARLRRSLKNSLLASEDTSESASVVSPSTESSPKKTGSQQISADKASVQKASGSSKRLSANVISPALEPTEVTQKGKVTVQPTMKRNTRLSTAVLSTPVLSVSGTRKKGASTKLTSGKRPIDKESKVTTVDCLANVSPTRPNATKKFRKILNTPLSFDKNTEEYERNLNAPDKEIKTKMPRGVKRKNNTPVAEKSKRMRKSPSTTTPVPTKHAKTSPRSKRKEPVTKTSPLTSENLKKHTRRHTVDVLPKNKRTKNLLSTQQKGTKKSPAVKRANTVSSRSTPDISILPVDAICTFTTKRPKSAPAAMKKSLPKDPNAIPRKGTLKRRRWLSNALKEKNKSYEDDIFENHKFATPFRIPHEVDEESDTSIATPKFGFFLTPAVPKRTPKYKDIISPSNLVKARKNAEEYLYRRQNRNKTNKIITLKTPAASLAKASGNLAQIPEKKKLEFAEAVDKIKTINKNIEAKATEESDEEDKDDYLSDISV